MSYVNLNIDLLTSYPNHPFALYTGIRMDDLSKSIQEHGIISPIVVRPAKDGKYEILSGHNRVEAAKRIGLLEVPVIIKEGLSDDEAALIVTESNLIQRSFADLKHSERAVVLKNHLETVKRLGGQGKRNDLLDFLNDEPGAQVAHKTKSRDKVAEQYALSKDTVMRYVRLSKLPKELLGRVDAGELKFTPAVEISWLSIDELNILTELFESDEINVSLNLAKLLRTKSEEVSGKLSKEDILAILNDNTVKRKVRSVKLSKEVSERLTDYKVSEKAVGDIISIYLDMLERGEVVNVFDVEEDSL